VVLVPPSNPDSLETSVHVTQESRMMLDSILAAFNTYLKMQCASTSWHKPYGFQAAQLAAWS
jgi:hypothetical protein